MQEQIYHGPHGHKCAECGQDLGPTSGKDAYAHTIACFSLENSGIRQTYDEAGGTENKERARRIRANLEPLVHPVSIPGFLEDGRDE